MKKIEIPEVVKILSENDNFLILTHFNPDGDTLGSGYGLMYALKTLGKKAKVVCNDEIPKKYSYMFPETEDEVENPFIVAVDVADETLLGKDFQEKFGGKVRLCLDHHVSNKEYAEYLYLRDCAAACEIIFDVIKALGVEFTEKIASCIYTGIATDTGCFMFSNVSADTHIKAAELIKCGADYDNINRVMFETKSKGYFMLEAAALETIQMHCDDRCAVMFITQEMLNKSGTTASDCDGIAGLPRKIDGVLCAATVRERIDGSYKVSLRSYAPVDASAICCKMGGGGHARAAGCEIKRENLKSDLEKLLSFIKEELDKV